MRPLKYGAELRWLDEGTEAEVWRMVEDRKAWRNSVHGVVMGHTQLPN